MEKKLCYTLVGTLLFVGLGRIRASELVITEILAKSQHTGPTNGDWWELTNTGEISIDLAGYSWDDNHQRVGRNTFNQGVIDPCESILIIDLPSTLIPSWRGDWSLDSQNKVYGTDVYLSSYSGLSKIDGISLYDPNGVLVTSAYYADQVDGVSHTWDTEGRYLGLSIEGSQGAYRSDNPISDLASPGRVVWGVPNGLAGKVYWTDKNASKIQRANRNGGSVEDVLTSEDGLIEPRGLAIDLVDERMYWVDGIDGTVQRANLDGTGIETLIVGLQLPRDLELDCPNHMMYWSDRGTLSIQCANMDGTGSIQDIVKDVGEPYYIELDLVNRKVYWSDFINTYIRRTDLDGPGVVEDVVTGLTYVRDVIVDPNQGWLYWGDRGSSMIQRIRLDGTGVIQDLFGPKGLDRPHGLALDADAGKLYWTDTQTDAVYCGNIDGSGAMTYLATGLDGPWSIEPILPTSDLNRDGHVDWLDFALFAPHWLQNDGGLCGGADLTGDSKVDAVDLQEFSAHWH